jgi:hypothetical protein
MAIIGSIIIMGWIILSIIRANAGFNGIKDATSITERRLKQRLEIAEKVK